MVPLPVLAAALLGLVLLWLALSAWVIVDRALHDVRRRRTLCDGDSLVSSLPALAEWSRARLWRVADGEPGAAASGASRELVRRDTGRLVRAASRRRLARTHALRVLARGDSPLAFEWLRVARAEGGADVVAAVVAIIAELESPQADVLLLDLLVTGDHPRSRTATELEPRVARLAGPLLELVDDTEPALRYWALMLLGGVAAEPEVVAAAARRADDPSAAVRGAAARVLGFCDSADALPTLRRLLDDDVFYVRAHTARAAGELGARSLAPAVAALLADRNWWVRAAAKEGLLALGDSGFEAAVDALNDDDPFARDGAAEAVLGSGRLPEMAHAVKTGDPWAAPVLATILVDLTVFGDETSSELLERLAA